MTVPFPQTPLPEARGEIRDSPSDFHGHGGSIIRSASSLSIRWHVRAFRIGSVVPLALLRVGYLWSVAWGRAGQFDKSDPSDVCHTKESRSVGLAFASAQADSWRRY